MVSGTGSILDSMLERGIEVSLVLADRPCPALQRVEGRVGATELLERSDWGRSFDRDAYTDGLVARLADHGIGLVAMAGFGTVLGPALFDRFPGRVLNTHPALLPSFPGWHAVGQALEAGVKVTGCTVHIATAEVDSGPILAQEAVEVRPGDTEESLHERIKAVERQLYPATLAAFIDELEAGGAPAMGETE
ncbi:MAG TPA: phosphoribosylglycinamide formyltransferase [Acidimicrobiales bacterium]|nr:phosphoribosylglycinamide formyltransferase [Acidimicrobiales bacterium]